MKPWEQDKELKTICYRWNCVFLSVRAAVARSGLHFSSAVKDGPPQFLQISILSSNKHFRKTHKFSIARNCFRLLDLMSCEIRRHGVGLKDPAVPGVSYV